MKAGSTVSATARAERSRQATKAAVAENLLYAGILARIWPSWVLVREPRTDSERKWGVWPILAVDSPAGWLTWRLSPEEEPAFDWIPRRPYAGEKIEDRTGILLALASQGWS